MENLQNVLSVAFELIVTVTVAALVWTTVMAGLYQLVRERIRQVHVVAQLSAQERYIQRIDTGPAGCTPISLQQGADPCLLEEITRCVRPDYARRHSAA